MTTPPVQELPQVEEPNPPQVEELIPPQMEDLIPLQEVFTRLKEMTQQEKQEMAERLVREMTPQQQEEMLTRGMKEMTQEEQVEMAKRLMREITPQEREEMLKQFMRELTPQEKEEMLERLDFEKMTQQQRGKLAIRLFKERIRQQMDEIKPRILENWFRAWQSIAEFLVLLLVMFAVFSKNPEIETSIYLWICFALVYAWLIKNRILSVYASYQLKAPLSYSLLSAAMCFATCIVAFYSYRQSQNLTILRVLVLCLLTIFGSLLETILLYKLRVREVISNNLNFFVKV